jgi:tetratricopeptide (TPR) repeat protein
MSSSRFPNEFLSPTQLQEIEKRITGHVTAEREDDAWESLQEMLSAARRQEFVAASVAYLIMRGGFSTQRSLEALERLYSAHPKSETVLAVVGKALDRARDINFLNSPPSGHSLFQQVTDTLAELAGQAKGGESEVMLLEGLSTAARMMARQRDDLAETSYRRLIQLEPEDSGHHYNFGLFLKTRGRFREGMAANQSANSISGEPYDEATEWNLGICATGAGEGAVAMEVWKRLNQKVEIGRLGLPEGSYADVKVRLAQRPLAERTCDSDDPGLEESIWIERLSPCHGIIRSVLYQDLGVDYGDTILIDGAPITEHTYGDSKRPVFPHLATLHRARYQLFNFAGTQENARQLQDASSDLEGDTVVYSHTEKVKFLCASCWNGQNINHEHKQTLEKHVVLGQIAVPPDLDPAELLKQLDAALARRPACRIYVPTLCEAAGLAERAAVELRRMNLIEDN